MKIFKFDALSSTNDFAKTHPDDEDFIVVAKRQTAGRGSKGRSFDSGMGGVYLTKVSHYTDFPAKNSFLIMVNAAVAVCKALEENSLKPVVKWPNDVYVNGRKICGILIENTLGGGKVLRSVVGIGVNLNNALPPALQDLATSVFAETGERADVENFTERLVFFLGKTYTIEDYREYLSFLGQKIRLLRTDGPNEREERVTALGVDESGRLQVRFENGEIAALSAGEVSVRL